MNKQNVILLIFLIVGIAYLAWIVYSGYKGDFEHFTTTAASASETPDYNARMNVLKVFDTILHRKPTISEIDAYSKKYNNEQDLLSAVVKDFDVQPTTSVVGGIDPTEKEVPAFGVNNTENFAGAATTTSATSATPTTVTSVPAKPSTTPTSASAVSQECPILEIVSIEKSLSDIITQVNAIRTTMYLTTTCS